MLKLSKSLFLCKLASMKNSNLFFATVVFMASCSSNHVQKMDISFDQKVIKVPSVNVETSQELGETLLEYAMVSSSPSWRITREHITKKNIFGVYYVFAPQVVKPLKIIGNSTKTFGASSVSVFGGLSPNGSLGGELVGTYTSEGLCFYLAQKHCLVDQIVPANYIDLTQPNIKQQLIYNGRVGNFVKFLYREVSEGTYLRLPFTQEVQYDLKEGIIIGFRGARIEILDATNRRITYKVIKHFSPVF